MDRLLRKKGIISITIIFVVNFCFGQTAPVISPIGGFNIDGFLERQGPGGDWLKGSSPLDAPGSFVFSSTTGTPLLPHSYRFVDLWNSNDDNVFFKAGFNENPNTFKWQFKKANAVKDINNSLLYLTKDASNHAWAIATADRYRNNSDIFLEFEFLQNPLLATFDPPGKNGQLAKTGGFVSYGPDGGRTDGDVIISIDFTGGGRNGTVNTYVWKADPLGGYSYQPSFAPAMAAENNAELVNVPFGAFGSTTYPVNSFVEVALDMTAATGGFSCLTGENTFRTIWIKSKTRSGNGFNYDDFVTPIQINVSNDYSLTASVDFFDLTSAQLTAAVSPGDISDYNFHWSAIGASINDVIDPTITGTLNNYDIYNPIFTADPDHYCTAYLYEVTIARKDNPGCIIGRTPVVINSPCKIGKPINPDKPNLQQEIISEVTSNTKGIYVYPNPGKGVVKLILPNDDTRDIELISLNGSIIQRWQGVRNRNIESRSLASGVYLLKIISRTNGEVVTKKIMITQ